MFSKLDTKSRRRRIISPTMLTLSAGAHVLLLGGVLLASGGEPTRTRVDVYDIDDYFPEEVKPAPVPPPPTPPQPIEQPRESAPPKAGDFVNPVPPDEIPAELPKFSPSDQPVTREMVSGIGTPGDVIGPKVPGDDRPPTGSTTPAPDGGALSVDVVEERPALRNGAEMQSVLQRLYPPLLRDAGIAGQTVLRFVVDAEGRVEAGSVTVVSTSHEGFEEASLRAAERFRFRPAKVGGKGVRVVISLPITWKLDGN